MTDTLRIYEVGLRDGLQNERTLIGSADKARLLEGAVAAGLRDFELTSFVSPKAVPQMADAAEMVARAKAFADARCAALVVNDKGYDRAVAAGARGIAVVVVVTETLCARNNRMSVAESVETGARLLSRARADGLWRRAYLAPAFVCPYEGPVSADRVVECADVLWEAGVDELAIADTIGHAHPGEVGAMFARLADRYGGADKLAAHLHDTQALGLANAAAAIAAGVRVVDASIGGLGGCPFAPGAAGNLATEDLVLLADKMGLDTGVDLAGVWTAVDVAGELVGRELGGRTAGWWRSRRDMERAA